MLLSKLKSQLTIITFLEIWQQNGSEFSHKYHTPAVCIALLQLNVTPASMHISFHNTSAFRMLQQL